MKNLKTKKTPKKVFLIKKIILPFKDISEKMAFMSKKINK